MYLLDTDIAIWITREGRGNPQILASIQKILTDNPEETGISTATIAEIYKNIRPHELPIVEDFLNNQTIISVSTSIAKAAGYYYQQFKPKLKELNIIDGIIAATAKDQKAKLITLNIKHFPMKDIEVLDPTKIK